MRASRRMRVGLHIVPANYNIPGSGARGLLEIKVEEFYAACFRKKLCTNLEELQADLNDRLAEVQSDRTAFDLLHLNLCYFSLTLNTTPSPEAPPSAVVP